MSSAPQNHSTKPEEPSKMKTRILPVSVDRIGTFEFSKDESFLSPWTLSLISGPDAENLRLATTAIRESHTPVAFPTETVYGLGADATSSLSVQGIYKAKNRPSDNPLIVHISSLEMLEQTIRPSWKDGDESGIPQIYLPLIQKFWPGPLTILLPLHPESRLAPEVSANLNTFGARMPSSRLALAFIHLAERPIAAPSANASTRPSPTRAEHVLHDLDGRIEYIVDDGGSCDVGVESTVVDGLSEPPAVLRPGGITIDEIRACHGWENTVIGYMNKEEKGAKPRAPGMKYKHYSPKARVILVEWDCVEDVDVKEVLKSLAHVTSVGQDERPAKVAFVTAGDTTRWQDSLMQTNGDQSGCDWQVQSLGQSAVEMARNLFSTLRDLDVSQHDFIVIEGVNDSGGDAAAAVMNRIRKAAEITLTKESPRLSPL